MLPTEDDAALDPSDSVLGRRFHHDSFGRTAYRGAPVERWGEAQLPEVDWRYNLHFGTARELLMLGRGAPSSQGTAVIQRRLHEVLERRIPLVLGKLAAESRCAAWYAAYLLGRGLPVGHQAWQRVHIGRAGDRDEGPMVSLGELDAVDQIAMGKNRYGGRAPTAPSGEIVTVEGTAGWLCLQALFPGARTTASGVWLVRDPTFSVTDDAVAAELSDADRWPERGDGRHSVPVPDSVSRLLLPIPEDVPGGHGHRVATRTASPWFVSGGVITAPALDRLVGWTAEQRGEGAESYAAIATAWAEYLRRFDPVLRGRSDLSVEYDMAEALATLAEVASD